MKQKETFSIVKMLSLILQLGLVVMAPVLLAVLLCIIFPGIVHGWIAAILILLALIAGAYAAFRMALLVVPKDEPEETFDLLQGWNEGSEGDPEDSDSVAGLRPATNAENPKDSPTEKCE